MYIYMYIYMWASWAKPRLLAAGLGKSRQVAADEQS